jgi:hypothetical protein
MTRFWTECLPHSPASLPYTINEYGFILRFNKQRLSMVCDAAGIPPHLKALMVAMAMQESTTMSSADRDASKDGDGDAANVSLFNLSIDLVRHVDPNVDPWSLNQACNLPVLVRLIQSGIGKWGIERFLNFVRGGRTAFADGVSYGAEHYREAIATILRQIDRDPKLLTDDRRVDVCVPHV